MGKAPRLAIFSMKVDETDADPRPNMYVKDTGPFARRPIDFKKPFKIFVSDNARVFEIYDSEKVKELYTPLKDLDAIQTNPKRKNQKKWGKKGMQYSGGSSKQKERGENVTSLPLMGPNGDISPWGFFRVIIRQKEASGNAETDYSDLLQYTPMYRLGRLYPKKEYVTRQSDTVFQHQIIDQYTSYDNPFTFEADGSFGTLKLNCIMFFQSRLVTVKVTWLGVGLGESHISGMLSFDSDHYSGACHLLDTPECKALKVVHGQDISLLRSAFPIRCGSSITVKAQLKDAINAKVAFDSSVSFKFGDFSKEEDYSKSKIISGRGAKIAVKLTMKPNDVGELSFGPGLDKLSVN